MNPLEQLQEDITARLKADEFFDDVKVLLQRKGNIENDVLTALGFLNAEGGKVGACVIVAMPSHTVPTANAPGPQLQVQNLIQVLENPTMNMDQNLGTLKSAEDIVIRIQQVLHGINLIGNNLYLTSEGADPLNTQEGTVGYEVKIKTQGKVPYIQKVITPKIEVSGTTVTLTCATPGAEIYYTDDESYPMPTSITGSTATLYTIPFTVTPPAQVRVCGFKSGMNASDVNQQLIT